MKTKIPAFLLLFTVCTGVGLGQEKLTPELFKRIEAESPKPLPQSPVVKRPSTDAQDVGYRGKVKRVIEEYRSYQDVCAPKGRLLNFVDDYDAQGNQLRNASFANCGNLTGITVYGFIDGFRASLYKSVFRSGSFSVYGAPDPKPNPPTQPPDKRYTYKYEYSYTNGQLTEMRMFHNDGRKGMYYRYATSPSERTTTGYSYDDELSWRTTTRFDKDDNEIGWTSVDVNGTRVSRVEYGSFDAAGNWTHRATYRVRSENGKPTETLMSEYFRTITYH